MRTSLSVIFLLFTLTSCSPAHKPVPPGDIPQQRTLSAEDEQYGHQVLGAMTDRYPLDRDDSRIMRVRNIVDKLANSAGAGHNPWHAHVLIGDEVKNAAATRGNVVVIWTGMLAAVSDDEELATILAHEMAHVLARHTDLNAREQIGQILGTIAGQTTNNIFITQSSAASVLVGLGAMLTNELIQAVMVNPETQTKELEADQIGLFLMADAGYNPEKALSFWRRMRNERGFSGAGPLQFLSSHPSSDERIDQLQQLLPDALARYRGEPPQRRSRPRSKLQGNTWIVEEPFVSVREQPKAGSAEVGALRKGTAVKVRRELWRWLEISEPIPGYIESKYLSPSNS